MSVWADLDRVGLTTQGDHDDSDQESDERACQDYGVKFVCVGASVSGCSGSDRAREFVVADLGDEDRTQRGTECCDSYRYAAEPQKVE
jgi:hypothetical protein